MTPPEDPGFLTHVVQYLWSLLLIPLGIIWHKADNAASTKDMKEACGKNERQLENAISAMTAATKESRDTMKQLFANAESDRMSNNDRFSKVQEQIYKIHTELLQTIHNNRGTH